MYTTKTLIIAGDIVSLYEFQKGILYGGKKIEDNREEKNEKKKENTLDSRKRSFYRAKKRIINLINSNCEKWKQSNGKAYLPIMYTLTFADDIRDINIANKEFTKFIQRLNYQFTGKKTSYLKYVNVIEFQDKNRDGVVHYHCLFFNLPFIRFEDFATLWGNGYVQYEKVNDVIGAGQYVSKYIAKSFDDERLCGKKCYFISRGLKQPIFIRNITDVRILLELLPEARHQDSYPSEYHGQIDYSQFYLKEGKYTHEDIIKILALRGYSDVE